MTIKSYDVRNVNSIHFSYMHEYFSFCAVHALDTWNTLRNCFLPTVHLLSLNILIVATQYHMQQNVYSSGLTHSLIK